MSLCSKLRDRAITVGLLVFVSVVLISSSAVAQSNPNPTWDLFAGYQWLHPGATVPAPFGDFNNPTPFKVPDMSGGFGSALTYNFDPHWGFEFDLGHNWGNSNYETTGSIGPRLMLRTDGANYFIHTLLSLNRASISGLNATNGVGAVLGGGMDLPVRKWLSFRLFEADYVWARHNYADFASTSFPNLQHPSFEGVRLRTGLVFNWGGAPPVTPAASCTVQPTEVMVGEPLTANVTASNFNPKHTVTYSWSGNGGTVTGKDTSASIDTTNATPGSYTVTAHVTDPKSKTNNEASCSANYTIKPLPPKNPPTMSCSGNPPNGPVGTSFTVTCSCTSPDGVPVSVASWTSSSGSVSGSGSSATLDSTGMTPGSVTVGATCTDSRGLTGQASTQVAVENPPPPPVNKEVEARLALGHSIYFPTAQPPITDPSKGLVASQQQTLIGLAADFTEYLKTKPDAHLTLVGHADKRGSVAYNQALSERRVARVKSFLEEHGVPEGALDTQAQGDQHNLTAAEVKASVEQNTGLTKEERARVLRNMQTIIWASNRRVDVRLSTTGQESVRQFPFNAADALTLIGGRGGAKKAAPAKKGTKKP
jgi:outer membrane protein OmpA-like peptidoglycan-associated protein